MSAQTGDQQQVSKGLLITLGVVAALGAAFALWVFVVQPMTEDEPDAVAVDDQAAADDGGEPDEPGAADEPAADDSADDDSADDDSAGDDPAGDEGDDGAAGDGAGEAEPPEETIEVVAARDPCQPLVGEARRAPATGTTGGGGGGGGEEEAAVGSTTVTLVDIYVGNDGVQRAAIEVDETGYDVAEGQTFAEHFKLLDIADACATMLHGDSRFTLCEGDRIRK
jgi:hypothetical protein